MGLGVEAMDRVEAGALQRVFGSHLRETPLVTLCPAIGNLSAGAGGVQAAVAAKCLFEQRLPARLHAGRPREGLLAGVAPSAPAKLEHVLVCTGALGGQNGALVLKRAPTVPG
jgi:3-oxoacyl-(acyl-carrier-protein) synthase